MFSGRAKPNRIIGDPDNQIPDNQIPDNQIPDNQIPDKWSYTAFLGADAICLSSILLLTPNGTFFWCCTIVACSQPQANFFAPLFLNDIHLELLSIRCRLLKDFSGSEICDYLAQELYVFLKILVRPVTSHAINF